MILSGDISSWMTVSRGIMSRGFCPFYNDDDEYCCSLVFCSVFQRPTTDLPLYNRNSIG